MKGETLLDADARYAQLHERVTNTSTRIVALENQMQTGFSQVNAAISTLANEFRSQAKTPWPIIWSAIGVSFTIIAGIGALAYAPISDRQTRIEGLLVKMDDAKLSRSEFDIVQDRGKETRERLTDDIQRGDLELQRQVDELKRQSVDAYSLRDVLIELKQNQKELQELVLRRGSASP